MGDAVRMQVLHRLMRMQRQLRMQRQMRMHRQMRMGAKACASMCMGVADQTGVHIMDHGNLDHLDHVP